MERTSSGKIVGIGRSLYLLIDAENKALLQPGDVVEYNLIAVAPQGKISQTKMIAETPPVRIARTPRSPAKRNRIDAGKSKCSKRVLTPDSVFFDSDASNSVNVPLLDDDEKEVGTVIITTSGDYL